MLEVAKTSDGLWRQCAALTKSQHIIDSELGHHDAPHRVIAFGPVAQRNPFQALLYSERARFNVSILPIHDLGLFSKIPWPTSPICHFHWIHDRTRQANTLSDADGAVFYWETLLRELKERGHKIVWTLHNVLPHDSSWIEHDIAIHQLVANAADVLHVMARDSVELAKPFYDLDARKIFFTPHPCYDGAQPDEVTREDARARLGIQPDEFVFLSFGAIMQYKGYDCLMASFDEVRKRCEGRARLIIAGLPADQAVVDRINAWGSEKPNVLLDMTPVPSTTLQTYFRAADLAVCPYIQTMNSGAAMMSITFDVPVLGPNSGSFRDLERMGCGITFEKGNTDDLIAQMENAVNRGPFISSRIKELKHLLDPTVISGQFFENLTRMLS